MKAKESSQVQKARGKAEGKDKKVMPESLKKMTQTIYRWLERHSAERKRKFPLKKNIAEFNASRHPDAISNRYDLQLHKLLKESIAKKNVKKEPLTGRIRPEGK